MPLKHLLSVVKLSPRLKKKGAVQLQHSPYLILPRSGPRKHPALPQAEDSSERNALPRPSGPTKPRNLHDFHSMCSHKPYAIYVGVCKMHRARRRLCWRKVRSISPASRFAPKLNQYEQQSGLVVYVVLFGAGFKTTTAGHTHKGPHNECATPRPTFNTTGPWSRLQQYASTPIRRDRADRNRYLEPLKWTTQLLLRHSLFLSL